jgi:hypothetical protein
MAWADVVEPMKAPVAPVRKMLAASSKGVTLLEVISNSYCLPTIQFIDVDSSIITAFDCVILIKEASS